MTGKVLKSVLVAVVLLGWARGGGGEEDAGPRCKKEIVESYNLNGYLTPRSVTMFLCPALKSSCCSLYDQFLMFTNWRDKIKPKLTKYYDAMASKLLSVKELVSEVMDLDFPTMIDHLHIDDKMKETHLSTFLRLNQTDTDHIVDELLIMQRDNARYMMDLRSSFYCSICDYESHSYIDIPKKIFTTEFATCADIASNTINFSYYMTIKLGNFLQSLSELLSVFALSEADKPVKIRFYKRVSRQIKTCSKQVAKRSGKFTSCKPYCEQWRVNANSPVLEGYHVFMNEMIASLTKFLKNHGKSQRILTAVETLQQANFEVPFEDALNVLENRQLEQVAEGGRRLKQRVLNDENEWFFDPTQAGSVKDPYDESLIDPNFDEYMLNQMFNIQEQYDQERRVGYARFISSKIGQIDVEPDHENGNEDDVFKTNTGIIVDLENFQTQVKARGFDVTKYIHSNNLNASLRDLIINLKKKSAYPILYEKLDPALLVQINGIVNDDVSNFHRDNFLYFRDFSAELKKDELEAKMNANA